MVGSGVGCLVGCWVGWLGWVLGGCVVFSFQFSVFSFEF